MFRVCLVGVATLALVAVADPSAGEESGDTLHLSQDAVPSSDVIGSDDVAAFVLRDVQARKSNGLPADPAFVEELYEQALGQPTSVVRAGGFVATQEEIDELQRQTIELYRDIQVIEERYSADAAFGGLSVDHSDGGTLVVALTSSATDAVRLEIEELAPGARGKVRFVAADFSAAHLRSLFEEMSAALQAGELPKVKGLELSFVSNRVIASMTTADAQTDGVDLVEASSGAVAIIEDNGIGDDAAPPGGSWIYTTGDCTISFAVRRTSSGTRGRFTAGHCGETGQSVLYVPENDRLIGSISTRFYCCGTDSAFIPVALADMTRVNGWVTTTSVSYAGEENAATRICMWGGISGQAHGRQQQCGWFLAQYSTPVGIGGRIQLDSGQYVEPGDSGGPYYSPWAQYSMLAGEGIGIHQGGSHINGGVTPYYTWLATALTKHSSQLW